MKKLIALAAFALLGLPAAANDTADNCKAYVAENGGDASGCDCLGAAAAKDAALKEALAAIKTPADLDAASEATKAAVQACFPDNG
ncbi:MAG: hypothetical protein ABL957_12865 [Parvularculaceae bacterium]